MSSDEEKKEGHTAEAAPAKISEDWLAVLIAFILFLLSVIGILGENGIMIKY
ncbi:hypothetical protein ACFLYP_01580 [Chloroflexota bacterium]